MLSRTDVAIAQPEDGSSVVFRMLDDDDADALYSAHRKIVEALPDADLYRDTTSEYLERHIREQGRTVGAFRRNRLIAYAVVRFPDREPDNLGLDLGLDEEELPRVAHFELSGVLPEHRGQNLQYRLNQERVRVAESTGHHHVAVTVSPKNRYSLNTHFKTRIHGKALRLKYGGMLRFVLHRDLRSRPVAGWKDVQPISPHDPEALKAALGHGCWAYAVGPKGEGDLIFCGRPCGEGSEGLGDHRAEDALVGL